MAAPNVTLQDKQASISRRACNVVNPHGEGDFTSKSRFPAVGWGLFGQGRVLPAGLSS